PARRGRRRAGGPPERARLARGPVLRRARAPGRHPPDGRGARDSAARGREGAAASAPPLAPARHDGSPSGSRCANRRALELSGEEMQDGPILVLCTAPDSEVGATLGRGLVEAKLAACVNIVPGLRSIYTWQGAVQDDTEAQLLIKTRWARFEALRDWLTE